MNGINEIINGMKNHYFMNCIVASFIFLCCLSAQAQNLSKEQTRQEYFPTGTFWIEALTNLFDESYCDINHYIIGNDTIINAISYKKVYKNEALSLYALREADEKVFLYLYDLRKEVQAYDFVWETGKELYFQMAEEPFDYCLLCTIKDIKQVQLSDLLYYDYIDCGEDCKIIKSIGSENGIFTHLFSMPTNGDQISLLCFSRGDKLVYKNPRFVDCESCQRSGLKVEVNETDHFFRYENNRFYFFFDRPGDITVSIYDTKGMKIYSNPISGKDSMCLDFLVKGIYFYKITTADRAYCGNLTVNN